MSKQKIMFAGTLLMLLVLFVQVRAIPESDIYSFRSAGRSTFYFDEFCSGTSCNRSVTINSYHNLSTEYYIIIRHHLGDISPYDSFEMSFKCDGDALPTAFSTEDYESWTQRGIISFKKTFANYEDSRSYDNTSIGIHYSKCTILSASNLTVDGNSGYTTFYIEVVPVLLSGSVVTVQQLCESESRNSLVTALNNGIWTVLTVNVNLFYTLWIVVQTSGVIMVVLGTPILLFLFFRWSIWKITGKKVLEFKS